MVLIYNLSSARGCGERFFVAINIVVVVLFVVVIFVVFVVVVVVVDCVDNIEGCLSFSAETVKSAENMVNSAVARPILT